MPAFLNGATTAAEAYERWLGRKAMAHVKPDRERGHSPEAVTRALYKEAIHAAVGLLGRESAQDEGHVSHVSRLGATPYGSEGNVS